MTTQTPLRQQYLRIKKEHPDALLLFRMGDFYETFDEDARLAARELEIALTSREMGKGQRVPLAGIPYHALESYLARLIRKGHRVAICEQVGDTSAPGLVERQVVRVVTPGTLTETSLLEQTANNYLASVTLHGAEAGLAFVDITTGEFATTQLPVDDLPLELERLGASEVVTPEGCDVPPSGHDFLVTTQDPLSFRHAEAEQTLLDHFGVATLEAYGCQGMPLAVSAAGAILAYLNKTQKAALGRLQGLHTYSPRSFMVLDQQTRRNLELFQSGRWGEASNSLLSTIDLTATPMGGRLLRRWLGQPLLDLAELERRLDAVQALHADGMRRGEILACLKDIPDLERLLGRIATGIAAPREVVALRAGLESAGRLRAALETGEAIPSWLWSGLDPCEPVTTLISQALENSLGEEGAIRRGFSPELDELRDASRNGHEYIAGLERKERDRSGIRSLKVGYNRVFGYYIEVSNPNLAHVPGDYTRRQTLVGGERFITPELKEYESMLLNAQERMEELESTLFRQVCAQICEYDRAIASTAAAAGRADVLAALAETAARHGYVRPGAQPGGRNRDQGRAASHGGAHAARGRIRPERHAHEQQRCAGGRHYRPQHVRQVDLHPAGGAHRAAGADRKLRARGLGHDWAGGPGVHAHRPAGRPVDGTVHVHGGDGGDRRHPAPRDAAVAGGARRDWAWHKHLRRPCDRPGHCGAHPQQPAPWM